MRLERIRAEICNSWEGEGTLLESRDVVSRAVFILKELTTVEFRVGEEWA